MLRPDKVYIPPGPYSEIVPISDWSAREGFPSRRLQGKGTVKALKYKRRRERMVRNPLNQEQADKLLQSAPEGVIRRIVRLLLWTGMHPAVLSSPKHFELAISRGNLTWLRPKTLKRCLFQIPSEMEETINTILHNDLGKSVRTYRNYIYTAARNAGLDDVSPLTLRHTATVLRLKHGERPEAVMNMLRCSSEVLWGHYAQVGNREEEG
jgi:integrase